MLFLVNMATKMNHKSALGSRIAEVHNGSSLFTGDAGQGESNIRRWIIENEWLEAIVALPLNLFYNTGIATHENPAIGVLLCASKDSEVVEYALSRSLSPALVAEYQTQLPDKKLLAAKLHEFYALNVPGLDEKTDI